MLCLLRRLRPYLMPAAVFVCLCLSISAHLKMVNMDFGSTFVGSTQDYVTIDFIHCPECKGDISIIVTSSIDNFEKRQMIRKTWARDHPVRFLLGEPTNSTKQKLIDSEAKKFDDIVQGTFIDSYRNLTHKSILGLMYVRVKCKSKFTLKTDDDVYIQFDKLKEYLKDKTEDVICKVKRNSGIVRKSRGSGSKWKVSYQEYAEREYPDYCLGNYGAILSSKAVRSLLDRTDSTKFLWVEDAFVTGILRQDSNISITNIDGRHFVWSLTDFREMENKSAVFWGPTSLKTNEFDLVSNITETENP